MNSNYCLSTKLWFLLSIIFILGDRNSSLHISENLSAFDTPQHSNEVCG